MKSKKILCVLLACTLLICLTAACSPDEQSSDKKMAWICESILTDGGWNEDGFAAIKDLAKKYDYDFSYQEDVPSTEVKDVLRNYAAGGYDFIISNEQYHCEAMSEIAKEFPEVVFGCVNGYVSTDNMISITGDMWQHNYLAGVMAGKVTRSNKIGLITYSKAGAALTMANSFAGGAKRSNPDVELVHVATGSFSDLAIGKEMAISLIEQGCDVIMCNSGDTNETVMDICIENGVYCVSSIVDRNDMSDEYVLGSAIMLPSDILSVMVDGYFEGTVKPSSKVHVMGIKEGIEEFRVNPDIKDKVDPAVFDLLEEAKEDVIEGKVTLEDLSS